MQTRESTQCQLLVFGILAIERGLIFVEGLPRASVRHSASITASVTGAVNTGTPLGLQQL